jgi:hypothetical protein
MNVMRRIRNLFFGVALAAGAFAPAAAAQTYYAALPNAQIQFFDASGNPLNAGKLYTYIAGSLTPQNSYTDSTGNTANANPVVLDSAGRASVWLASTNPYKLILHTSADVLVWEKDNVSDFGAILKRDLATSFTTKSLDGVKLASQYSGANAGAQIAAAIADVPSSGGILRHTSTGGTEAISSDIFSGITKPVYLELGGATYTVSANMTVPANVTISFAGGAKLSVNSGITLTYNGGIDAPLTQIFAGSGTVTMNARAPEIYPEWFGAARNGSTDDSAAIQRAVTAMSPGGVLKFSHGTYYMTDTVTRASGNFEVRCAGERTSLFKFVPASAKSAWKFTASGNQIADLVFRDCGFTTTDTASVKVAIEAIDVAEMTIERVTIGSLSAYWRDSTEASEGISIAGRQNVIVSNTHVYADRPLRLKVSPNTDVVELDASNFTKNTLVAYDSGGTPANAVVTIDDGVALTNVAFRDNNLVLGRDGFYWVAPSNSINSYTVVFENNRLEQTDSSGGYCFDLEPGHQSFSLELSHNYCPGNIKGIKVRTFKSGRIANNFTETTLERLNLDSSSFLAIDDNMFNVNAGGATIFTVTGFVPNRWCGNDRTGAGNTSYRCALGVAPTNLIPTSPLLIPNTSALAGLNVAGNAEVGLIGLSNVDEVSVGSTGATTTFGSFIRLPNVAFASLGTPANGTAVYCGDCTKATPCAGVGPGAIAKRLNGAWDCN